MANASENKSAADDQAAKTQGKSAAKEDTDVELIKAQLERVREDVSSLAEMVGLTARQRFGSAKDQLANNAEAAREQAVDHFTATLNEAEASVRRSPLTALMITLGIGFLFGLFTRK